MRLIDADYITEGRVSNDPVVVAAKCAPTIDAIPVEWLRRQYHKYMQNNDKLMCDAYAVVIGEWYEWQKEQEAQDG